MLELSVRGRRIGRIAFGAVLLVGAALLVHRLITADDPRAGRLIFMTWGAAAAAYVIAGWIGSRRALDHAAELEIPGLVVPGVGLALLLPLTIHLLVAAVMVRELLWFDEWAQLSLVITGPTHVVLATLVAHRARQLATGAQAMTLVRIYVICVAVSCLPFAILVLPPVVVALTGLPVVALMAWMEPLALRERRRAAAEALPRAIALT